MLNKRYTYSSQCVLLCVPLFGLGRLYFCIVTLCVFIASLSFQVMVIVSVRISLGRSRVARSRLGTWPLSLVLYAIPRSGHDTHGSRWLQAAGCRKNPECLPFPYKTSASISSAISSWKVWKCSH